MSIKGRLTPAALDAKQTHLLVGRHPARRDRAMIPDVVDQREHSALRYTRGRTPHHASGLVDRNTTTVKIASASLQYVKQVSQRPPKHVSRSHVAGCARTAALSLPVQSPWSAWRSISSSRSATQTPPMYAASDIADRTNRKKYL